jgi:hypothetical protein
MPPKKKKNKDDDWEAEAEALAAENDGTAPPSASATAGDDDDDAGTKPAKKVCASKPATIVLRGSHSSRVRLMFLMVASASHWTG